MNRTLRSISLAVIMAISLPSALAQGQSKPQASPSAKQKASAAAQNKNTPGRIAKFTNPGSVDDANITEDASGKIGIGTSAPTSPLTVQGMIETTLGGYKFPDGTIQTTAGLASVFRDTTLKGNGTQASPLGVAVPLKLNGDVVFDSVLTVSNTHEVSTGIKASGGPGGFGVFAVGGDSIIGGTGVVGRGGSGTTSIGGA